MKQLNLKPRRPEMTMELLHRNVQFRLFLLGSECDDHHIGGRGKSLKSKSGFGQASAIFLFFL
jgi:hypothetical protein